MTQISGSTKCATCGIYLPDDHDTPSRQPCLNCGSVSRDSFEHLQDGATVHDQNLIRSKHQGATGKRKYHHEMKDGYEFSKDGSGRLVYKYWVIDHDAGHYTEVVQDAKTLEFTKYQSHPLPEHRGHGSDKPRKLPVPPILAFYRGDRPDNRGRHVVDILAQDDDWLEHRHDYVQWLFPLPEPSGSNPHAPLLDRETIAAFQSDVALRDRLRSAYLRMLSFYGLREHGGSVDKGENWGDRKDNWAMAPTHNDLRITRILRSMCLLGLRDDAESFKACLLRLARDPECDFDEQALAYWRGASADNQPVESPSDAPA